MSLLPAISLGTLMVFGVVWAALHDIARGELDTRLEWSVLALTVPAFVLLRRVAGAALHAASVPAFVLLMRR